MIRLDDVRERIAAMVPALEGRLGNAAGFNRVIERNQVPQITPAAFVLFGGIQGGAARAATGMFVQDFSEVVTVVLMDRVSGDALGDKALRDITPMVGDIIEAVCGWAPDDAVGVFALKLAELAGVTGGALVFHIEFYLTDQLRITS